MMFVVGVTMIGVGYLITGIANRGSAGELDRNGIAGIRTKATMASDEAWLTAHQVGRDRTAQGGQLIKLSGLLAAPAGLAIGGGSPNRALLVWGIVFGLTQVAALWLIVRGAIAGDRAAQRVVDEASTN